MGAEERNDADITLGEVNRNVSRLEQTLTSSIRELKEGFVSKAEHSALAARVKELEESAKLKVPAILSAIGIVVSAGIAIWAIVGR